MTPSTPALLAASAGTALTAVFPALLAPSLAHFGPREATWRLGLVVGGAVAAAAVGLWSRSVLPRAAVESLPKAEPIIPLESNGYERAPSIWGPAALGILQARAFPLKLTRLLFLGAVLAAMATGLTLASSLGVAGALLPAVVVYLMFLLPVSALFFLTRFLLRPLATSPIGVAVPLGGRQPLALRLTLAVQLPVLLCALGMVLVEQTAGSRYEQNIEQYGRDRYARLLDRVIAHLPNHATGQQLLARLTPPEGVLIYEEAPGQRTYAIASASGVVARPLRLQIPLLFLALGVVVLTLLYGRWLPREITAELQAVRRALDALEQGRDPGTALAAPHGLRETSELAQALERALAGFDGRRLALSAAAADRRDSERRKALFLGHLSHELKSPLNSILGFSELLLAGIDGPLRPRQRDQLAAVWRQGESLDRFILALLDATRLGEAGRAASLLTPETISLNGLAAALTDQLRPDPLEVRLVDIVVTGPGLCRVDPTYTVRALRLLTGLLIDRMDAGRIRVTFTARPEGGALVDLQVREGQADPAERAALVAALRAESGPPDPRSGAVPVTRLVLEALDAAQGSHFAIRAEDAHAWPRLQLELPAAA